MQARAMCWRLAHFCIESYFILLSWEMFDTVRLNRINHEFVEGVEQDRFCSLVEGMLTIWLKYHRNLLSSQKVPSLGERSNRRSKIWTFQSISSLLHMFRLMQVSSELFKIFMMGLIVFDKHVQVYIWDLQHMFQANTEGELSSVIFRSKEQ